MTESGRERLPDIYYSLDYRVLLEVGRWELAGRPDGFLRPESVAHKLGEPPEKVQAAVGRLWRASYIDAIDASTMSEGEDYMVRRMLQPGLEETGLWPESEDLALTLRRTLEAAAIQLDKTDPERGKKARAVLEQLGDLGTSFTAKVAAELLKALTVGG
jgi:hypothetical protein